MSSIIVVDVVHDSVVSDVVREVTVAKLGGAVVTSAELLVVLVDEKGEVVSDVTGAADSGG